MPAVDNLPLRQAALTLHALSPDDRGRVWARLDADKRSLLEPLLTELTQLGVPAGQAWVDVDAHAAKNESETPPDLDKLVRAARRLRPQAVLQALSTQSLDTAACVLAWTRWPWREAVLSNWSPENRHSLSQRVQERGQAASSPFVMATLLDSLLRDARALPPVPPAKPGTQGHWFNRLFQR